MAGTRQVHLDLQRDHRNALVGGLLFCGLIGVAIVVGVFAMRPHTPPLELLRSAFYAFPGAASLMMAALQARSASWYRRCSEVFYERAAVPMRLRVFRSRSGGLMLELHKFSDATMREAQIRIQPQAPRWDTTNFEDQVVKVHLDDDPMGPVVVETPRGILWPAPLSRRVNGAGARFQ